MAFVKMFKGTLSVNFHQSISEMKVTYAAAASLDGFIARENGDVSWLDDMNISEDDSGVETFFNSVDGLVMGRNTYDFVFDYGAWPYADKPTWVFTHRDLTRLDGANLIVATDINDAIHEAGEKGLKHLWLVGGGQLASLFLAKKLLTHVSISEMPIKLGLGIPLFADQTLEDISAEERNIVDKNGFRQIEVVIKRD